MRPERSHNYQRRCLVLAVALLFLLGWSLPNSPETRVLVVAQNVDVQGFDPHQHSHTPSQAVYANLFDLLIMKSPAGELLPALASDWRQLGDMSWWFQLREDVLWHDGAPFTAVDVKFSLERVSRDNTLVQYENFRQIREVELLSDYEIIIHTHEPDPILLLRLSRTGAYILPQHYAQAVGWDAFVTAPLGTGPFELLEWRRDDRLVLAAFEQHWRGRPHWDRVVHRSIPEDATRVAELLTGNVHIATNLPPFERARIERSQLARSVASSTNRVLTFTVNTTSTVPTGDLRVRQAIDYAIDNQLLVDLVMDGLGVPMRARLSAGIAAAPMQFFGSYNFNQEYALALLRAAGYGEAELRLKLQAPSNIPMVAELLEVIAVMLAEVGILAELELLEPGTFNQRVWSAGKVEHLALRSLGNSMGDAQHAYRGLSCDGSYQPLTNWCNEDFDRLYQAAATEMEPLRRAQLIEQLISLVTEDYVQIYLFNLQDVVGISESLDWQPRVDELLWFYDALPRASGRIQHDDWAGSIAQDFLDTGSQE